jgi:hypothetical protein
MAEEHRGAEPVRLDDIRLIAGAEAGEKPAAVAQPGPHARE